MVLAIYSNLCKYHRFTENANYFLGTARKRE